MIRAHLSKYDKADRYTREHDFGEDQPGIINSHDYNNYWPRTAEQYGTVKRLGFPISIEGLYVQLEGSMSSQPFHTPVLRRDKSRQHGLV